MIEALQEKLTAAITAKSQAEVDYRRAALGAEEGPDGQAAFKKASQALAAAAQRVEQLRSASQAAEERETARMAEEEAERERAKQAAIDSGLDALREIANEWDRALSALAEASQRFVDAERVINQLPASRDVYQKIAHSRAQALPMIQSHLREFTRSEGLLFQGVPNTITECLPRSAAERTHTRVDN